MAGASLTRTDPEWVKRKTIMEDTKMSVNAIGSTSTYSFIDRMVMNAMKGTSKTKSSDGEFDMSSVMSSSSTAGAQRPMGPPPPRMDSSEMASKVISALDTNGDGVLSASESKLSSSLFKTLDTNSDGSVSSDELVTGLDNERTSKMASHVLKNLDTNGDGVLSSPETGLSSTEFNTLDTNGDGTVTLDELQAGIKARDAERSSATNSKTATTAQETTLAASADTYDSLQALIQALAQNQASSAYSSQNLLTQMLQSASQKASITA
jgi:Ca2+-binding EF-hand superfamily protein